MSALIKSASGSVLTSPTAESIEAKEKTILAAVQRLLAELNAKKDGLGDTATPRSDVTPSSNKQSGSSSKSRLLVIANRLPISLKIAEDGSMDFKMSSGGLVSAMLSVRGKVDFIWLGWLGCEIAPEKQDEVKERLWKEYRCVPVFLSDSLSDAYYNGFANSELWPRFHYEYSVTGTEKFDHKLWVAYQEANRAFSDAVLSIAKPDDRIWIHDYHLMLMPQMLREKLPDSVIAWFLHIPWPSSEIYRMLPVRTELLKGLLESDYLGFHTYDYARHFISSCSRVLHGVHVAPSSLTYHGRTIDVGVFPIGIEPQPFVDTTKSPACQTVIEGLCTRFEGLRVIVAVDRLDPIKGIPHRLLGLETLFRRHPEWVGKVVFLQVAVPSRTDVVTYQRLTSQVNQLVGSINGEFGNLTYQPVHYMYRSVPPVDLAAYYNIGDVALITSLRDGMNLVAEEYVACQSVPCRIRNAPGALVLSEFAGSAQSLAGAIRVNPWSPEDIAKALNKALLLGAEERQIRWKQMYDYVCTYTSTNWALSFVDGMEKAGARALAERALYRLPKLSAEDLHSACSKAVRRLFVFALEDLCELLEPSGPSLSTESADWIAAFKTSNVVKFLKNLADDPRNVVVVGSNVAMETLEQAFDVVPRAWLIADGGALIRTPVLLNPTVADALQKKLDSIGSKSLGIMSLGHQSIGRDGQQHPSIKTIFGNVKRENADAGAALAKATLPVHTVRLMSTASPRRKSVPGKLGVSTESAPPEVPGPSSPSTAEDVSTLVAATGFWYGISSAVAGARARAFKHVTPPTPTVTEQKTKSVYSTLSDLLESLTKETEQALKAVDANVTKLQLQTEEDTTATLSNVMWKETVRPIINNLADQTPGSYIVETDNAIRWHFEKADPDLGAWQAKELQINLETTLTSSPVDVLARPSFVEVKNRACSAELALLHMFDEYRTMTGAAKLFDLCICITRAGDAVGLSSALSSILSKQPFADPTSTHQTVPFAHPKAVMLCRIGDAADARGSTDAQFELPVEALREVVTTIATENVTI